LRTQYYIIVDQYGQKNSAWDNLEMMDILESKNDWINIWKRNKGEDKKWGRKCRDNSEYEHLRKELKKRDIRIDLLKGSITQTTTLVHDITKFEYLTKAEAKEVLKILEDAMNQDKILEEGKIDEKGVK
jgi:hypothetical protein